MYLEKWEFYAFFIQYALGRISNNLINRTNRHLFNEMPPSITSRTFFCGFSKIYFNLGTAETIIHSWGLELGNFKLFWRLSKFSRTWIHNCIHSKVRFLLLLLLYNFQVFQDTLRLFNRFQTLLFSLLKRAFYEQMECPEIILSFPTLICWKFQHTSWCSFQ